MIKRRVVVLLSLALLLASCGGTTSTPTRIPATQPPVTAVPSDEPTAELTAENTPDLETATPEIEITETPDAPTTDVDATAESTLNAEGETETTETESTVVEGVTVTIAQIDTALRSGPSTGYDVVARTSVSDGFPVIARFGEGSRLWYQIQLPDGTNGWVWSRVATLNPPDAEVPVAENVPPTP